MTDAMISVAEVVEDQIVSSLFSHIVGLLVQGCYCSNVHFSLVTHTALFPYALLIRSSSSCSRKDLVLTDSTLHHHKSSLLS
jgi:hypothetical protein